jgi:CrcB protein
VKPFALVAVGGAVGTLARHALSQWLNPDHTLPLGTLAANVTGSFLLGALLAVVLAHGRTDGRARTARLLLGTGLLGGYTTYSTLAVETETFLRDDRVALGLTYAVGTVALGLVAALAGIAAGRRVAR